VLTTNLTDFRDSLTSTSYAVLDSGYKYTYDKYNDVYRYVPLKGDIAGLAVYTDTVRDPWYSPAGFNRGRIKNVIKRIKKDKHLITSIKIGKVNINIKKWKSKKKKK